MNPIEELKAAVDRDDAAAVRGILNRSPELKARIDEPIGPFDSPAIGCVKSREMLDALLEAGADINAKSRWWAGGFGILHSAEPDLAEYAIGRGAIVDIHAAARLGKLERLRELLDADPELVHARGGDGQTPLHFAASVEIARRLLEHGTAIDARDIDHESTPAQYMVKDRQDVARFLVKQGCQTDILMAAALGDIDLVRTHFEADPDRIRMSVCERDFPKLNPHSGGTIYQWTLGRYMTPHRVARKFGHEDIFEWLENHSPPELRLVVAAELGDEPAFRELLATHPEATRSLSDEDRSKVVHAAEDNNTRGVGMMLDGGWPADARGRHGGTPLHWAGFHGNSGMTELILAKSPPLEVLDDDFKETPLGWAIHGSEFGWYRNSGNYAGTVATLLRAGAIPPEADRGSEAVREVLRRHHTTASSPSTRL